MNNVFYRRLSSFKCMTRLGQAALFTLGLLFLLAACSAPIGIGSAPTSLSGNIKIDGSTALQPLTTKAAQLFKQQYPQVHIDVGGGGSLKGLDDVTSRAVDIGDSDVYADPATYPDPNLTDHLVCVIPFTMIVSSDVKINNLTMSDIVGIFATNKYTNWDQFPNGPNLRIVPIVRPPTSGTRATFRRYVLGGLDERSELMTISSSQDIVNAVAKTPGAISYLAASVLNSHVHALSIDGYAATLQNIEDGHYSFWSYEHMYTLNVANGSPVETFLNFMFAPQIQQEVTALHYIPTSDLIKIPQLSLAQPPTALYTPYFMEERKKRYVL